MSIYAKISAGPSRVTPPAELNEVVQYIYIENWLRLWSYFEEMTCLCSLACSFLQNMTTNSANFRNYLIYLLIIYTYNSPEANPWQNVLVAQYWRTRLYLHSIDGLVTSIVCGWPLPYVEILIFLVLYHFELFGMACDPWPLRRNFTSADASGTRDTNGFWISARLNFGLEFSHFLEFLCHACVTPAGQRQSASWQQTNSAPSAGSVTRDCRTIRNGTVCPKLAVGKWLRNTYRVLWTTLSH